MLEDEKGQDLATDSSLLENQIQRADEINQLQQLYSGINLENFLSKKYQEIKDIG